MRLEIIVLFMLQKMEWYAACEKCIHKGSSLSAIFVTAYGDCYHSTLGCSGLKRTIKAVRLKDVGRLRPCSRCASGR